MVQNTATPARPQATTPAAPARTIVVRMGEPGYVGFVVPQESTFMDALSSGDMATRTAARASFTIATV